MSSKLFLTCEYCGEEKFFTDMVEYFEEGWIEMYLINEDECNDFCSKECAYLYLEENIGKVEEDE